MQSKLVSLVACSMLFFPSAAFSQYSRQEQTQACQDDAIRLCGDVVPDEARVAACMHRHKAMLSPQCRQMFQPGRHHAPM